MWTFEVQQHGQTIGQRRYELGDASDAGRLPIPGDPYTVDVRIAPVGETAKV